ncbi:MobA/MobL family protein [Xanthomonas sp. NCPPB 2632]|uniref:MobA/MobL family protein n=1 Tax=Xanthomonas sp. NCPPB 2632 TaxID=3240912 RepID=UPI003513C165
MHYHARPHLSVHTRAKAHSAVAGAAYRLGLRLYDERTKTWHDYRKRALSDSVVRALTIAPDGAPPWASDPAVLWNAVEGAERRKDGQVARDYRCPVPIGFDETQAADLAEALAAFIAEELHTSVSVALHRDAARDAFGVLKPEGQRGYHAHLYFPTRPIKRGAVEGAPAFGLKLEVFRDQTAGAEALERLNAKWAELSNLIASASGLEVRVDHRSYKRMGTARTAEPQLGQAATALERQGTQTRLGDALLAHRATRDGAPAELTGVAAAGGADAATTRTDGPRVTPRPPSLGSSAAFQAPQPTSKPAAKLGAPAVVTPRPSASVRRAKYLTQEEWMQSPVAWEPPPIVGLAERFDAVYVTRVASSPGGIQTGVMRTVKAVQWFLNALVMVGKALLHLDREYKRFSTVRFDLQCDADQKREALGALRREHDQARRPYTPRMQAAHRRRLAQIRTIEEEVAERARLSVSIDAQMADISQRAKPWRSQAIHDRFKLKGHLAELERQDHQAVEDLLSVANSDELPWLKLYTSKTEPTLSLQKLVDAAEAAEDGRKVDRTTQKAHRPPRL